MKIELDLPDFFIKNKGYSEYDIKMFIANKLYEIGVIGLNAGGEIAGISRLEFMDEMGKYGRGVLDISKEDLEKELNNARKHRI